MHGRSSQVEVSSFFRARAGLTGSRGRLLVPTSLSAAALVLAGCSGPIGESAGSETITAVGEGSSLESDGLESAEAGIERRQTGRVEVDEPGDDIAHEMSSEAALSATSWQRVLPDGDVFGGDGRQSLRSVTAGGPGFVAVGRDEGEGEAAVWTSEDAVAWQRVPSSSEFGPLGARMQSVTEGGPGLVAVGSALSDDLGAVWTSLDGLSWQRVARQDDAFPGSERLLAVAAGGPGLIAVGEDRLRDAAAVWVSPDGLAWRRIAHDEQVFGGSGQQQMHSVTQGNAAHVSVGSDGDSAAVWVSMDGLAWQRVPHDEQVFGGDGAQSMRSVVANGQGFVAVGSSGAAPEWSAVVWVSMDGLIWQRISHDEQVFGGDGAQSMQSIVAGGPGFVAVGRDGGAAAVWTSTDGLSWQRTLPNDQALGGDGAPSMADIAAGPSVLVAVGSDWEQGSAAVWTSP